MQLLKWFQIPRNFLDKRVLQLRGAQTGPLVPIFYILCHWAASKSESISSLTLTKVQRIKSCTRSRTKAIER